MKHRLKIVSKEATLHISGEQAPERLQAFIENLRPTPSALFILTEPEVEKHCLRVLLDRVPALRLASLLMTETGEKGKTIAAATRLWQELGSAGADRGALLVNLGGGVVTDLGGWVASAYMRGIRCIHVPTTVMGQVDAAIGGKTGINLEGVKNQIGSYYPPLAVIIYPGFLGTLPFRQRLSGFAETVKCLVLAGGPLYRRLMHRSVRDLMEQPPDSGLLRSMTDAAVRYKLDLAGRDFYEKNVRKRLNFGHTIGHALESLSNCEGREPLTHGEAVAAGMICAVYLSASVAGMPGDEADRLVNFLANGFRPIGFDENDFEKIMLLLARDKKNRNGRFLFTLLSEPGRPVVNAVCSRDEVISALRFYRTRTNAAKR